MKRTSVCKMETAGDLDPLERLSRREYKAAIVREKRWGDWWPPIHFRKRSGKAQRTTVWKARASSVRSVPDLQNKHAPTHFRTLSGKASGKAQPEEAPSETPEPQASDQYRTSKINVHLPTSENAPARHNLKKHRLKCHSLKHQISVGRSKTTRWNS